MVPDPGRRHGYTDQAQLARQHRGWPRAPPFWPAQRAVRFRSCPPA